MRDWRKYQDGTRHPADMQRMARHHAAKLGYRMVRSRRRKGPDNAGEYMLIDKASWTVSLGAGYTATEDMILEFLEREQVQWAQARSDRSGRRRADKRPATLIDDRRFWDAVYYISETPPEHHTDDRIYRLVYNCRELMRDRAREIPRELRERGVAS